MGKPITWQLFNLFLSKVHEKDNTWYGLFMTNLDPFDPLWCRSDVLRDVQTPNLEYQGTRGVSQSCNGIELFCSVPFRITSRGAHFQRRERAAGLLRLLTASGGMSTPVCQPICDLKLLFGLTAWGIDSKSPSNLGESSSTWSVRHCLQQQKKRTAGCKSHPVN